MAAPSQMYAHTLNPLKGWPRPTALDLRVLLHSAVTIDPFPAGRCVSIHSTQAVTSGASTFGPDLLVKTGATGNRMALFTLQGSTDLDVKNDGGTDWYPAAPKGVMNALVAVGAYELETTEFDTSRTYVPNDVLKAVVDDTNATAGTGGGCLTNNATVYTDSIVGVVSRGTYTNPYGKTVLAFWPVYLPLVPA